MKPEQFYREHELAADRTKLERGIIERANSEISDLRQIWRSTRGSRSESARAKADVIARNQDYNFARRNEADMLYLQNIAQGAADYAADPERYHRDAIQEAHDAGVEVNNFQGDMAVHVKPGPIPSSTSKK